MISNKYLVKKLVIKDTVIYLFLLSMFSMRRALKLKYWYDSYSRRNKHAFADEQKIYYSVKNCD